MEHIFDEAWIRQKQFKFAMENEVLYRPETDLDKKVIDKFLEPFIKNIQIDDKEINIIDIGCGHGYAMEKIIEHGFENVQGLTLHKQEWDICKKEKKLNVHLMNYNFSKLMDKFFHAIWMRQSLQFSFQPFYTMLEMNRTLRLKGYMYIEVPDTSNAGVPLGTLDADTYKRIFEASGFKIIQADNFTLSDGTASEKHNFFVLCKQNNINLPEIPEDYSL